MSSSSVSLNLFTKNPDEDFNLVKQALEGNCDAFKELFMRNVNKVNSLCLRLSSDIHLAEDLTQEVFIKAWEKLGTFKFESKFSTWLHSIAVNQFMMNLRSRKRESGMEEEFGRIENSRETRNQQDSRIDIAGAIKKLPAQAKAILILHDIEGYKHNEISEMMSIQTGTSKAHLHRARRMLREELAK